MMVYPKINNQNSHTNNDQILWVFAFPVLTIFACTPTPLSPVSTGLIFLHSNASSIYLTYVLYFMPHSTRMKLEEIVTSFLLLYPQYLYHYLMQSRNSKIFVEYVIFSPDIIFL